MASHWDKTILLCRTQKSSPTCPECLSNPSHTPPAQPRSAVISGLCIRRFSTSNTLLSKLSLCAPPVSLCLLPLHLWASIPGPLRSSCAPSSPKLGIRPLSWPSLCSLQSHFPTFPISQGVNKRTNPPPCISGAQHKAWYTDGFRRYMTGPPGTESLPNKC